LRFGSRDRIPHEEHDMQLGASEEFTSDELAILKELQIDGEQQAPGTSQASEQQPAAQTTEGNAPAIPATTTTPTPEAGAAAAAEPAKPQGDVRAALRASRRAEQRARDEADRLKREVEELRSKVPAQQAASDELTDEEIAQAEKDFPLLGKTARFVKKAQAQQPAAAAPAAQPNTEFVPLTLPPQVQDVVDATPDLLAWQYDPDQSRFELAIQVDTLLQKHPAWASKTFAERAQEVVNRVTAELGNQPAPTRQDPAAVLAAVPRQTPDTLSHLGGGGGKQPEAPTLQRYQAMSDEAIVADLLRGES
jgi:hypothetical protein